MAAATLDDILATDELAKRPSRDPDYQAEAAAIAKLAETVAGHPRDALQCLTDIIVGMDIADSAGVSLREPGENPVRCTWQAVSGAWRAYVGHSHRLDQTPCGVVIAHDAAMLFRDPGRYFTQLVMEPGIDEILLVPFHVDDEPAGVIWAVSHSHSRRFEREDVRLLLRLAAFASVACRMADVLRQAEAAHEQARAELRETELRFRQLVEGIPQLLWRATDAGRWTWASPQWTQFTGQSEHASHGFGWLDRVHPDDRRRARRAWRLAEGAEAFDVECRIHEATGNRYRWFQARAAPVRDESGAIVEWLGTATEIDDLKSLREHERVLLAELQHRVRNTLAVVRSIARRTAENSDGIEVFQMHFDGRLGAFARSQSLVTRDPNGGVDLESLVAEELFAHHAHEGERATIAGPPVRLKPKIADILGLAIHELAVNAVKYGGLSSDRGTVEVTWQVDGPRNRRILTLNWADSAPDRPVARQRHHGFGSELIERSLIYELDAESRLDFGPDGVHCMIRLPLAGRTT